MTAGQQDFRVPYGQSLSAFTALQRRGIESRLLIFPDENHWILKPNDSLRMASGSAHLARQVVEGFLIEKLADGVPS